MKGYWPRIWQTPARAALVGCFLSGIIASTLYLFNWHTFYDTRTNYSVNRAKLYADDIASLALATNAAPGNDEEFRKALKRYQNRRRSLIAVRRLNGSSKDQAVWVQSNNKPVDETRTVLMEEFLLEEGAGQERNQPLQVIVKDGIRPHFLVSLARAWAFSILDYSDNPERWRDEALYNRSVPLYGYFLTILLVGFGTIRAIYRDQQELIRLEQQACEITDDLDRLRQEHSKEVAAFKKQVKYAKHQREDAVSHREQLTAQLDAIEHEYQELVNASPDKAVDDTLLQDAVNRKSQVERVLASYNVKVAYYENELHETRSDLNAAEQLLHEVEEKRQGLNAKLKARNREIRKLQGVIQGAHKEIRSTRLDHLRAGTANLHKKRDWEESDSTIEEQLGYWVKTGDHTRVNFSSHSRAHEVEEQFERIDAAFVDRYFTHVNNSEYERGARRLIRIVTGGSNDDVSVGKLIVVLDEDAGRTISLRYETRRDAPHPVQVGFVLALLLRTKCRDFRHFSIRSR